MAISALLEKMLVENEFKTSSIKGFHLESQNYVPACNSTGDG